MNILLQLFDQMRLEILDVVFHRRFPLRLVRGRRKDNRVIEIFQIGVCRLKHQFIAGMFCYSCLQVIRYEILCNAAVELYGMYGSLNKLRQLFVHKGFCIDQAAYA